MGPLRSVLLLLVLCAPLAAQVAFGHPTLQNETIDQQRLRDLILGRSATWSDGSPVILILVREQASAQAVTDLTGMSLQRLLRGWKRMVFAGGGAMPVVVDTPAAAISLAGRRRGALALVANGIDAPELTTLYQPAPN